MAEKLDSQGNRRSRRIVANWPALVLCGDKRDACTILDLSTTGARLSLNSPLPPKSSIALTSEKFGALDASVVWSRRGVTGIRFLGPPNQVALTLKPLFPELAPVEARPAGRTAPAQFGRRGSHSRGRA